MDVGRVMQLFFHSGKAEEQEEEDYEPESDLVSEDFDDEDEEGEEEGEEDEDDEDWTATPRPFQSPAAKKQRKLVGSSPARRKLVMPTQTSPTPSTPTRTLPSRSTPTRTTPSRSRSRSSRASESESESGPWKTEKDPDSAPDISRFQPRRKTGIQLETLSSHSPKELFQLFFATDTVLKMCKYTNKHAAKNKESGRKYKWVDVELDDLYKFFGLLFYMSLVSLSSVQDYWRQNHILYVPFPAKVMSRDRFRTIFWNIYLSDLEEDKQNDKKKGTPGHDKLARVRPLYEAIRFACQAYYHPKRELAVDERMVATKAKTGMTQYMKSKPIKWGIKLFVLAESCSGYTIRFNIYTGKTGAISDHGLAYDVVMNLIQESSLGTGYHIYMDNFYTTPRLFKDLASMKFGACGTYREGRTGFPRGRGNAFTRNSERGSVRWIRQDRLLFVKWLDTREVSLCSTIHPAYSGDSVKRRMKDEDGCWTTRSIPCPTPVLAYNKNMGGVDLSDQLIQYYSAHRRTARWYRTLLLHFLDIASTNAYILHRELSSVKSTQPMTHKEFMTELVRQLCDVDMAGTTISRKTDHVPMVISDVAETSQRATKGRRRCKRCFQEDEVRRDTPWKCQACNVALCLVGNRNCFLQWHK